MATDIQNLIAEKLSIDLLNKSPRIAAAIIEDYIFEAIYPAKTKYSPSAEQIEYAKYLGIETQDIPRIILFALIAEELEKRNITAIANLNLKSGDRVIVNEYGFDKEYIISSIGKDYRLWFKGGNGRGAWPSQVKKCNIGM